MIDDRNLSEPEPTEPAAPDDDDLRFAPPGEPPPAEPRVGEITAGPNALDRADEMVLADAAERGFAPLGFDLPTGGMDIEAALAAVSSLSDVMAEREAAEQAQLAQQEAEAAQAAERQARLEHPERFFPVPPPAVLKRGSLASVTPALVLIASGAWLTLALTTGAPPGLPQTLAAISGGAALALLSWWLSSGRWGRGALFLALILLGGAAMLLLVSTGSAPLAAWPLLLAAPGAAFILTALLGSPRSPRLLLPGLLLLTAAAAGLLVTLDVLPRGLLDTLAPLWPGALALVVVIGLLPLVLRRS